MPAHYQNKNAASFLVKCPKNFSKSDEVEMGIVGSGVAAFGGAVGPKIVSIGVNRRARGENTLSLARAEGSTRADWASPDILGK